MQETRKTILVIEDEAELRELLVQALELDFNVVSAADGVGGLTAARQHLPDLIVCDYNMPVRNGLYTISEVRSDPALAGIPIILMSGQREPEGAGPLNVSFLAKPFPLDSLFQAVNTALTERIAMAS